MSVAESIKSYLGNLIGAGKTETVLRFFVTMLLLFLVARAGADLSWQLGASLLTQGHTASPNQPSRQIAPANPQTSLARLPPAVEEIALFGQAAGIPSPAEGRVEATPISTLNLVLKGIVAVRPMRRALAVIAERGGVGEHLYGQGEMLAGNAVIREIHPDRVIISRAGALETLFLEGFDHPAARPGAAAIDTSARAARDYIQPKGDGVNWLIKQNYWQAKLADVPGLAREVGVEVYAENKHQKGYRLVAIQNSRLLNTLGLLPGDILLSINGRAMDSAQAGISAYQQLKSGGQVTIGISRNGRQETRVYNIDG